MSAAFSPLPLIYQGNGLFQTPRGFIRRADERYGAGQYVLMTEEEERSSARHRAFFASVREIHKTLPEGMAEEFPTPEALRKAALIATGWRDEDTRVYRSHAEALRAAEYARRDIDPKAWAKVVVSGCVVVVLKAKSQAVNAMKKEDFEASADAVLRYLAETIGVEPAAVPSHEAA
jgi:hypothetical protein